MKRLGIHAVEFAAGPLNGNPEPAPSFGRADRSRSDWDTIRSERCLCPASFRCLFSRRASSALRSRPPLPRRERLPIRAELLIPAAHVQLVSVETGFERMVEAQSDGRYLFSQ